MQRQSVTHDSSLARRAMAGTLLSGIAAPILAVCICSVAGCAPESPADQSSHTTVAFSPVTPSANDFAEPAAESAAKNSDTEQPAAARQQAAGVKADPAPARPPIRRVGPDGVMDITFDDLALDMPVGTLFTEELLTPRVKELDGKHVRLRGFIFAGGVFQTTGITDFLFVMNTQCKFGPQGLAYCVIMVNLDEGVTTDFTTLPITVEGKLTVRPYNDQGFTWSVYHMQGTRVY